MLKMVKLEFENHKDQYFSWLLRSEQVKTNIFENSLSLFDFKQLLVDSGTIVQCSEYGLWGEMSDSSPIEHQL